VLLLAFFNYFDCIPFNIYVCNDSFYYALCSTLLLLAYTSNLQSLQSLYTLQISTHPHPNPSNHSHLTYAPHCTTIQLAVTVLTTNGPASPLPNFAVP
jgi:hypothetical protein